MKPFERISNVKAGVADLKMIGSINESAELSLILFQEIKTINIDLSGVTFINSTGILSWIEWFIYLQIRNKDIQINFFNCPKIIVDQMNNVKGFLPKGAKVKSFAVPFYCESCNKSITKMATLDVDYTEGSESFPGQIEIDPPVCDVCGQQSEIDYAPQKYLYFLTPMISQKKN
jgi:hypothetical protein